MVEHLGKGRPFPGQGGRTRHPFLMPLKIPEEEKSAFGS